MAGTINLEHFSEPVRIGESASAVPSAAAVGARRWQDRLEVGRERFLAATSACAIRAERISTAGVWRDVADDRKSN